MKNLLIAVDESEAAFKAAQLTLPLADAVGAKVCLLLVVPPMIMPGEAPFAPLEEIHRAETRRGLDLLQAIAKRLGRDSLELIVKIGPAAETIVEVAEINGADLVVVGSTGKGAVKRMLVGSTADRVVHLCSKPVLVVR